MGINGLLIYLEMLILQKSGAMGGDREKKLSDIKKSGWKILWISNLKEFLLKLR